MLRGLGSPGTASPVAVAVGVALLHLILAAILFDPTPHTGGDNAAYVALARSLLEHGRYVEPWTPGSPLHTLYPPAFPALLAAALGVGLRPWVGLKVVVALVSGVAVALSYLWLRARTGPTTALLLGVLVAVAPGTVEASHWVLSDVPFWAVTMGAILALERRHTTAGVLLAFLALATRTAGLPLIAAILVWLALRRRWRTAAAVALTLVVVVAAWSLRSRGSDVPYVSQFWLVNPYAPGLGTIGPVALLDRVVDNLGRYGVQMLPGLLFSFAGPLARGAGVVLFPLVGGLVAGLAAAGLLEAFRRPRVPELFLPLYVGMLLVWPATWAGERFLLPVLPLLLLYAARGLALLTGAVGARGRGGGASAVPGVAVALLLAAAVPGLAADAARAHHCRAVAGRDPSPCLLPSFRNFVALAEWAGPRLPPGSVVVSRKPRLFYHYSGLPGVTYPFVRDPAALLETAREWGSRYVVRDGIGGTSRLYLDPALDSLPGRFCGLQAFGHGDDAALLLGILPDSGDAGTRLSLAGPGGFPLCPAGYVTLPGVAGR